jgi:hypothetical protein
LSQKSSFLKNLGEIHPLQSPQATDFSDCSALEITMKRKVLIISGVAAAAVLAGGWALAQTAGQGPGFGPPFMQGHGGKGPGMMQHMMQHKGGMGPGMMGKGMMQHEGGAMGPGMMQQGSAGHTPFDPARLATLKTELGITATQEPAWTRYTKAVEDAATAMASRTEIDPETIRNMSPADRFAFVSKIRERAQIQFTAVQTAANELLAVLDETQKAKARTILPGLAFGPPPAVHGAAVDQQHQH